MFDAYCPHHDGRVLVTARVLAFPAADPHDAAAHFAARLAYETDCSDVYADLEAGAGGFVVLDARSPEAFASGHIPGARNLPHATITAATAAELPRDHVLATYCWGPHCNAATKAAARLAALGYQVKEMLGGVTGWVTEGYALTPPGDTGRVTQNGRAGHKA